MKKRILALLTAIMMLSATIPAMAEEAATVKSGYDEIVVARDYDHFMSSVSNGVAPNGIISSSGAGAGTVYEGQNYFANMSGGKGAVFANRDFGDGADEIILDVKFALSPSYSSEGDLMVAVVNTPCVDENGDGVDDNPYGNYSPWMSVKGFSTSGWEDFQVRHYPVSYASDLKGVRSIKTWISTGNRFSNIYSIQFNKVVNPYQPLLADDETITASKEIKSLGFGNVGASYVTLQYNEGATGTVKLYKDTINGFYKSKAELHLATITLDGSGYQSVAIDQSKFTSYADIFVEVTEGVTLSQVEFSQYKLDDLFKGKLEVNALYIGNGDWAADTKASFEANSALEGRSFIDTPIDLSEMTDVEYVDALYGLNEVVSNFDIIFIQAGDRAQNILDVLSLSDNPPYTVVIGNAPYASGYGVKAVEPEGLALGDNYATPEYLVDDRYAEDGSRDYLFNTIDYDYSNGPDQEWKGHAEYEQPHTNGWKNGSYIVFEDVRFVEGVKEVKIKTAHKTQSGSVRVRLDSLTGPIVADFANVPTNASYTEYQEITKPALTSVEGVHDIYVECYTANFQNFYTLEFVTYGENVTKDTDMNAFNWLDIDTGFAGDILTFKEDSYANYNVDFGTASAKYNFYLDVAAEEGTTGKVVVSDTDGNKIAEFDLTGADGNFKKLMATTETELSGVKEVVVTYEGEGSCNIRTVEFDDYKDLSTKLDVSNYAETTGKVENNTNFGGMSGAAINYVVRYILR